MPLVVTEKVVTLPKHGGLQPQQTGRGRLAARQTQKLQKASEKVNRAKAKIEQRRKEWADL